MNYRLKKQKLSRLKNHQKKCLVCESPHLEEMEERYLHGISPYEFEREYGIPHQSSYRHIRAFGLDGERYKSLLPRITWIFDRVDWSKREISDRLLMKCLDLEAKLSGELYAAQRGVKYEVTREEINARVDRQLLGILKRLGVMNGIDDLREPVQGGGVH